MKIELGKTYVNRIGQAVTILEELVNPVHEWVFRGDTNWYYSKTGSVDFTDGGRVEFDQDLVAELGSIDDVANRLQQSKHVQEAEDMVNSPSHYTQGSVECIDAIQSALSPEEFKGYLRGNILKYMWRTNQKGGKQDLEKSLWYLNKLIGTFE